jgi:riboflavin transporter FmnP
MAIEISIVKVVFINIFCLIPLYIAILSIQKRNQFHDFLNFNKIMESIPFNCVRDNIVNSSFFYVS